MSLSHHARTTSHWFASVLSFATRAGARKRQSITLDVGGVSDDMLSDIGVPRCLLLAGCPDWVSPGSVD